MADAVFVIGDDGTIYQYVPSTNVLNTFASPPSAVVAASGLPARGLKTDGQSLYTLFPNYSPSPGFIGSVAACNLTSATWTISGSPFNASLDTLYVDNTHVVVGGSNSIAVNISGSAGITYASIPNRTLVANPTGNTITTFKYLGHGGAWQLDQVFSGAGSPSGLTPNSDGTQILVPNPNNNVIQVMTYDSGTWLFDTVAAVNPVDVAITPGGLQALVCEQSVSKILILNNSAGMWNPGQLEINMPGTISSIAINSTEDRAIVSTNRGVSFLTAIGLIWEAGVNINLNPTVITAVDSVNAKNTLMYAAGISGGNTTVYLFDGVGQKLVGQYTFAGQATTLQVINFQIVTPLYDGGLNVGYYVDGHTSNTTYSNTVPPSGGGSVSIFVEPLADFSNVLWIAGINQIESLYYAHSYPPSGVGPRSAPPFARVSDSNLAFVNGGSWITTDLQDRNRISSIAVDTSGSIFAVTTDNDLYKFSGTALVSGYPYILVPPPGQNSGTPLGSNSLVWNNGVLYSASSLAGGIFKITGT